jgi:hypothetical protein
MIKRIFKCEATSNQMVVNVFIPGIEIVLDDKVIYLTKDDAEQLIEEIHYVLCKLEGGSNE